jgi:hypothetical protein
MAGIVHDDVDMSRVGDDLGNAGLDRVSLVTSSSTVRRSTPFSVAKVAASATAGALRPCVARMPA